MDNRSRKELIAWLTQIINNELNKSDNQIDMDLILECSDYLDELQKENNFYTERDIQAKIAIIKKEVENSTSDNKTARIIRNKHSFSLRKKIVLAIAAAFIVTLLALTAVAHAQNYDSTWEFIESYIYRARGASNCNNYENDSITITTTDQIMYFDNLDEWLSTENTSLLYPAVMPYEKQITSIYRSNLENGNYRIMLLFGETKTQIIIYNYLVSNYVGWTTAEVYTYENVTFYLLPRDEIYMASCQYGGYEYTITSDTRDSLIEIINNLKEYQP